MAITQLSPSAWPGRRYGSFVGKAATEGGSHPVGLLTQLSPSAWPGRRYGSFVGRAAIIPEPIPETPTIGAPSGHYRRWRQTNIYWIDRQDEEELMLILAVLEQLDYL